MATNDKHIAWKGKKLKAPGLGTAYKNKTIPG